MRTRWTMEVRGIVQGVGFRPFVLREANALGLSGSVANTAYGVRAVCEGEAADCRRLRERILHAAPPGSVIFSLDTAEEPPRGERGFAILSSCAGAPQAAISPDLGVCDECARELLDPSDRRYRYPFLNCTACGPRFTIVRRVPYDRANTSMDAFTMCDRCAAEYADPANRRFHAQPNACAACGPRLTWLENGRALEGDPLARFAEAIRAGKLVGVRGLGGYHLACDATNEAAVARLRERKRRYAKPLAVMVADIAAAETLCRLDERERAALLSPRKPIMLLRRRPGDSLAPSVAPGQRHLGLMLPYTPLHLLLMQGSPPLVLTSANVSDAPMPFRAEDAARVAALCDAVLTHDRPILRRMDDSVCQLAGGAVRPIRRARGYAPEPIPLPGDAQTLALGAQQKNTFCLTKEGRAYLSGHIGDLDNAETLDFARNEMEEYLSLFDGHPQAIACDMHPDYASTRLADELAERFPQARRVAVQHHRAHFASVLAEHRLPAALGFIWDGTGYGDDGTIWGGELLLGGIAQSERVGRLRPLVLPGGEAAVREPWRVALAAVTEACDAETAARLFADMPDLAMVREIAARPSLSPQASSMGRLFDAVAAVAGLETHARYEGQAAASLEQRLDEDAVGAYTFTIDIASSKMVEWDWRAVLRAAVRDRLAGESAGAISARFHRALVRLALQTVKRYPDVPVALSGGVFQNAWLLGHMIDGLAAAGRQVCANERVPANDGGICYGQAAVAAALLEGDERHVSGDAGDCSAD